MAFENPAALNYAAVNPEYYTDPADVICNMAARVEARAIASIKKSDWGQLAGYVFIDPYARWHISDSALWLMLFAEALKIDREFLAALLFIRGGGTVLVPDSNFGYKLVPVIAAEGWPSQGVYDDEKQCLNKWSGQLMRLLAELERMEG